MIVNPLITMLGVIVGGRITYKLNLKSQHEMMKKQLILQKLEVIKDNISDTTRGMSLILSNLNAYCKDEISKDEFIKKDNEYQEKVRISQRNIWVNKIYAKCIENNVEEIFAKYKKISNFIYDNYHLGGDCRKELYESILEYYSKLILETDNILELIDECMINEINSKVSKLKIYKEN